MGGCCGCFEKKDDLNEVNQNDILWLQTSSSLTAGIPSNMHFSIGGLSNVSGQEPAAVTCARKAQEKLEREKGMAAFVTYLTSNVNSLELIDLSGDNKVYFVRSSLFFNLQSS